MMMQSPEKKQAVNRLGMALLVLAVISIQAATSAEEAPLEAAEIPEAVETMETAESVQAVEPAEIIEPDIGPVAGEVAEEPLAEQVAEEPMAEEAVTEPESEAVAEERATLPAEAGSADDEAEPMADPPAGATGLPAVVELDEANEVEAEAVPAAPEAVRPVLPPLLLDAVEQVELLVNQTRVLRTRDPYSRVSVGQDAIVEINPITPTSVLLTAKQRGRTQLILWDDDEREQVIELVVQLDLRELGEQLNRLFPGVPIEISGAGAAIVLQGQAPNLQVAEQAALVAAPFAEEVLNFIEVGGGQQVMLQVRFAEVSRSASSALGVNFASASGSVFGGSNVAQLNPTNFLPEGVVGRSPRFEGLDLPARGVSPGVTVYGGGQIGTFYLEYFLQALRQNNLLRILAEPNLITMSGQEASFLAGGEFPIPIAQAGATAGAITVEFREFGVRLSFVPVVLGNGRVRLKVTPEVSDLDFSSAVQVGGFLIPGLSQRRVSTTIELADGQTFAIAGLLSQNASASKEVVPLLGDLPVVGVLFRSVRYQRRETELVVLVTPRLVAPMNPGEVPALPGEAWRHPAERELFFRQDVGGPAAPGEEEKGVPPAYFGRAGFQPPVR